LWYERSRNAGRKDADANKVLIRKARQVISLAQSWVTSFAPGNLDFFSYLTDLRGFYCVEELLVPSKKQVESCTRITHVVTPTFDLMGHSNHPQTTQCVQKRLCSYRRCQLQTPLHPPRMHEHNLSFDLRIHVHEQECPIFKLVGVEVMGTQEESAFAPSPQHAFLQVLVGDGVGEDELADLDWKSGEGVGLGEFGLGRLRAGFGIGGSSRVGYEGLRLSRRINFGRCHGLCE